MCSNTWFNVLPVVIIPFCTARCLTLKIFREFLEEYQEEHFDDSDILELIRVGCLYMAHILTRDILEVIPYLARKKLH